MKPNELDALIEDCLEGRLSETDAAKLSARLEQSAEARARYWEAASIHGLLEHTMQGASLRVVTGQALPAIPRTNRWLSWRPLAAAAAGLVIGLFSASMVWAYAGSWPHAVALVRESFENGAMKLDANFPRTTGVWSGDTSRVVVSEQGVEPKDGTRMLRLEPVKDMWNAQSFIVDLRQLGPAPTGAARVVRLAASFRAAPSEIRDRYMARAAAFVETPGEIDPRWMNDLWGSEENHAVAQAARATTFPPGTPGWQTLQLTMDLPPGSRFLVISLRAATMHGKPEFHAAHYLDDVRVTLETLQTREAKP